MPRKLLLIGIVLCTLVGCGGDTGGPPGPGWQQIRTRVWESRTGELCSEACVSGNWHMLCIGPDAKPQHEHLDVTGACW